MKTSRTLLVGHPVPDAAAGSQSLAGDPGPGGQGDIQWEGCVRRIHSHCLRLADKDPLPEITAKFQVAFNDMCRVILRKRRADHIKQEALSDRAGVLLLNHTVSKRAAILAWDVMHDDTHPAATTSEPGAWTGPQGRATPTGCAHSLRH